MTKKSELYRIRLKEKRDSRIKETRSLISNKTKGSLMNNQKWNSVFELIESGMTEFKLKTLLNEHSISCDFIRELEGTSILIDNSGNYIEFLEIERLTFNESNELIKELRKLNVEFTSERGELEIHGYRMK